MVNKYNLCDKVRTKIHYENDNRKEVDAFIRGIELVDGTDEIRYKIWFEPEEFHKKTRQHRLYRIYKSRRHYRTLF